MVSEICFHGKVGSALPKMVARWHCLSRQGVGSKRLGQTFFGVRSCLYVKSDPVPICTETLSIIQEILRAKSDAGALMQFDRRPMALPYPDGRRLEADHRARTNEIGFRGRKTFRR
jgi:hypothetical protein